MVVDEKTKVGIGIIITISLIFFFSSYQTIEIIYFTNPKCLIVNKTDKIINEIKKDFENKVYIREIKVSMYPDDPPDTEDIKQLRDRYQVYGVPEIIINGKRLTKKYTKDNLVEEICNSLLIKPEVCG